MVQILNKVPYECRMIGLDTASGKQVSNVLYYRSYDSSMGYGSGIPGSDLAAFEDSVYHKWYDTVNPPMALLNQNYRLTGVVIRPMLGRAFTWPQAAIIGITPSLTATRVVTATPHFLTNGGSVSITGVSTPALINGVSSPVVIISPTEFEIPGTYSGVYTGAGLSQRASGPQQYVYGDKYELSHSVLGALTGEAMPLFTDVSFRRLNAGVGRAFRSRISMAPLDEAQCINGRLTSAAYTLWTTCGTSLVATLVGGTATMYAIAVSRSRAMSQPTPFTQSDTWAKDVSAFAPRRNLGSLVRRKPRLTTAIS